MLGIPPPLGMLKPPPEPEPEPEPLRPLPLLPLPLQLPLPRPLVGWFTWVWPKRLDRRLPEEPLVFLAAYTTSPLARPDLIYT